MTDQFLHVPLAEIAPSLTNPRTTFSAEALAELAEDIKRRGVDSPITLRPLPGARVQDTDRKVKFEIVFGERRYRASQQAGVATIPARVRDMSDQEALEAQLVENLHRSDLTALEEAEGYQRLMEHSKLKPEQVAEKIGKSRTWVYNRLKLLDLGTEGRAALREGKIDYSVGMLVARIPDGGLQAKALKQIVDGSNQWIAGKYIKQPLTYREAQAMVQEDYMLKLTDARFKITAVDLLPNVGSCKDCTKRTGANPDLFSDVKSADVCTDPTCFHKKEDAHDAKVKADAKAKGQTVIVAKEAQELVTNSYTGAYKGYKRLDNKEDSPTDEPLRKIIGKLMDEKGIKPTMLENPRKKGQLEACLPNDVANSLLKAVQDQAKVNKKEAPPEIRDLLDEKAQQEKDRLATKFEREVRAEIVANTWSRLLHDELEEFKFPVEIHRMLARQAAWSLDSDGAAAASKVLSSGSVGASHGLREVAEKHTRPDLLHLLFLMHARSGEGFDLVTQAVHGDKLKEVVATIKAEVKERVYPKAKKAPAAKPPAAQAKAGAGGKAGAKNKAAPARAKTMSPEEATQGIAAAMQGLEGSASAPKGAVAPPAAPGGVRPVDAWPFPDKPTPSKPAAKRPEQVNEPVDDLYVQAREIVVANQKASKRLLKEELSIGQDKAMALLEQLQAHGVVSAAEERGTRRVLVAA